MFNVAKLSYALGLVVILASCSTPVFVSQTDADKKHGQLSGLTYYLPKTLVTVKIEPFGFGTENTVANLSMEEKAAAGPDGHIWAEVVVKEKPYRVLVNRAGKLAQPLILGLRISNVNSEQVADPGFNYTLSYKPNAFFQDRVCASASDDGLLQFVEAQVKDRTTDVLVATGKLFGDRKGPDVFSVTRQQPLANLAIEQTIDPFDSDSYEAINTLIDSRFPDLRGRYKFNLEEGKRFGNVAPRSDCSEGKICYRTRVPIRFGFKDTWVRGTGLTYTQKVTTTVANRSSVSRINVTRAFGVEKLTSVEFENGVLKEFKVRKPSQAVAAAQIPLTVYDAIVTSALAAPKSFLEDFIPVIGTENAKTIIDAQTESLKEVQMLIEKLNEINQEGLPDESETANSVFKTVCN